MQNDAINTAPIQQFIQKVKAADSSHAKEVKLDLLSAKNLAYTLGMVMSRLNGDLEKILLSQSKSNNETIEVKLDGGNNW